MNGPFTSYTQYQSHEYGASELPYSILDNATDDLIFPLFIVGHQDKSISIIERMLLHGRLDSTNRKWRFVPVQGDLNATLGKPHFNFEDIDESG